jgi:hypothetical protein
MKKEVKIITHKEKTKGFDVLSYNHYALLGFILAFLSWFSILGVILCIFGLMEIKAKKQKGYKLAVAGIIIGIIVMILTANNLYFSF